jgi:DNA-binding NarL/FixJ family response regulator
MSHFTLELMNATLTETVVPVRVLVVEDHPIVRLGIRQMIGAEPRFTICGEAESANAAFQMAKTTNADLAIVDLSLQDGSGLELIRALREAQPDLLVLVLSMHDEALFAERALRAGARGYIMKQEAIGGLLHAIHEVLAGRLYVSPRMSQALLERLGHQGPAAGGRLGQLTDRELEVFELIGRGLNTAAIAARLSVSVKTVETYRSNIKTKLDLKDAADLIRHAATWAQEL